MDFKNYRALRRRALLLVVLLMTLAGLPVHAGDGLPAGLKKQYLAATADSVRIRILFGMAAWYADRQDDPVRADSVAEIALRIARASRKDPLEWQSIHGYVGTCDPGRFNRKALDLLAKAEQMEQDIQGRERAFDLYADYARVHLAAYRFELSLTYAYKALSVATNREEDRRMVEAYLLIGRGLEGMNRMIDAFRNYISAVTLAEKLSENRLLDDCYADLSRFYSLSKLRGQATRYALKRQEMILGRKPVDSAAFMWTVYDLQVIDLNAGIGDINGREVKRVMDFALRNHNDRLRKFQAALYRSRLIEANDIGRLRDFYFREYPQEWGRLYLENPALFYRLKALFYDDAGRVDSAFACFRMAAGSLEADPNQVLKSKFYHRYGQFLLRHGKKAEALEMFRKSYGMAEKASYFNYMILAASALESLYAEMHDFRMAYDFSIKSRMLKDSLNNLSKKDQILVMEIDHETRMQELLAEQQRRATERRHNLQYTGMVIAILSAFVLLIMLGSMHLPRWIIRMLGFFSFIFLFEFIVLLADHKIHAITQGEPWKVLLIKIFLIAILLPLHHEIEKRVIAYVLSHQLIRRSHFDFLTGWRKRFRKTRNEE